MKNFKLFLILLLIPISIEAQNQIKVFFDFNLDIINDSSKIHLDHWITENKEVEVQKIYGFSDEVGNEDYNAKLSQKRADFVYKTLKDKNIKFSNSLEIKAFGKNFNLSKNQDQNRKAIIYFAKPLGFKPLEKPDSSNLQTPIIYKKLLVIQVQEAKVGDVLNLENLNFYLDSNTFLPNATPMLSQLLYAMKRNEKTKIEIQGHNCCMPFDVQNLSTKRAKAVYKFLKRNGIKKNRISYKGYGSTIPLFPIPEITESERVANRRIDILILEK